MKADLHCHTVLSDGAMRVDQIIPYAKRIGLDYIAISDHESTHSIPEAVRLGKELGVHAIPAVEANAWHEETQTNVHILCYYPIDTDRLQHSLSKDLKKLSDAVTKSYQSLMDEYPITMDQLYEVSKESTGVYYTHIMQVLSMTGGTDFHGLYTKTPYPLGSFLCPKEGLYRLILAGEQANKAFYEKHPKFKK